MANRNDEESLRRLLRDNYMEGKLKISFQREPDFFESLDIEGKKVQVALGRDLKKNKIIGFGIRSIREMFVNGSKTNVGYLSNLRLDKNYRGGILIGRAYKFFKELHSDSKAKLYLTSILEDNHLAIKILTSGRGPLPPYKDYGAYTSYAIGLKKRRVNYPDIKIKKADKDILEKIISFIDKEARKKQFYPVYKAEDFLNDRGILRNLNVEDIFVALKGDEIIGTIGMWDQTSFKQDVVSGYSTSMKIMRPLWNLNAFLKDMPLLPPEETTLNYFFASSIAAKNNNPHVFGALLEKLREEGKKRGYKYMIVGLHSEDSLNSIMLKYPAFKLRSRIFLVHWEDGEEFYNNLDNRTPYMEVATL